MAKKCISNRMAELEKKLLLLQAEKDRLANHSLPTPVSEDVAAPSKKKSKKGSKSIGNTKKGAPATETPMDIDTEVDDIADEPPKLPTQRRNTKGATRADIEEAKKLEAAEGSQGWKDEGAREHGFKK